MNTPGGGWESGGGGGPAGKREKNYAFSKPPPAFI